MISVSMATYNGEKYIEKQIMSILNQSYRVDEIIIYDDCSTDRTVEIIKNIADDRIRIYINDEQVGYIENFYRSIKQTTGDYIFLADQDDIWEEYKVYELLNVMKEKDARAVCSNFSLIDSEDKIIVDRDAFQMNPFLKKKKKEITNLSLLRLAFGNIVQGCTYCIDSQVRDIYVKIHNEEVIHDYQIMLIAAAMGKVLFLDKPLIRYRLHGNNAVGFSEKSREIKISKKISREPFMARFFKQINREISLSTLPFYIVLYYLRVPFIIAILRRKILRE